MTFRVFNTIKHPNDNDSCFKVDVNEAIMSRQLGHSKPLKTSLTHDDPASCDNDMVKEYVNWMDSFGLNKMRYFESLGASPIHLILFIENPPSLEEKPLPTH